MALAQSDSQNVFTFAHQTRIAQHEKERRIRQEPRSRLAYVHHQHHRHVSPPYLVARMDLGRLAFPIHGFGRRIGSPLRLCLSDYWTF